MSSTEPDKSYLLATATAAAAYDQRTAAAAAAGRLEGEAAAAEAEGDRRVRVVLLGLCAAIAAATLAGGVYSLFALSRMRRKTSLCLIVASLSVDDLLGVVPLSLSVLLQWGTDGGAGAGGEGASSPAGRRGTLCTLSGLLYVFHGVSGNMTACLIAAHTFYVTKRFGALTPAHRRPRRVIWAVAAVWTLSLLVSLLPLCGWGGGFAPATLGCFPERRGVYGVLLFALYSVCCGASLVLFAPLTYQLLCSREPQRTLFQPGYFQISGGLRDDEGGSSAAAAAAPLPLCEFPSRSRDSLDASLNTCYDELSPAELRDDAGTRRTPPPPPPPPLPPLPPSPPLAAAAAAAASSSSEGPRDPGGAAGDSPVWFAQKRFSMILAVVRVVLWMPIMTLVLLRHTVDARLAPLETLGFFLTLLAPAATPLFALSERWNHLPCGCFIHCKRDPMVEPKALKRRFEFSLSFQQGYRVYKLSPAAHSASTQQKPSSYHNLFQGDFHHHAEGSLRTLDAAGLPVATASAPERSVFDFSTTQPLDSSSQADLLLEASLGGGGEGEEEGEDNDVLLPEEVRGGEDDVEDGGGGGGDGGDDDSGEGGFHRHHQHQHQHREQEQGGLTSAPPVFEVPERRLSHVECRKIELSDWEWCRSKSERTPRQGTVSLQAPTGKTLSLSTYEVSSDGLKISPTNAKKVEVYRSKSVGHEPSADDPSQGGGQAGGAAGGGGGGGGSRTAVDLGLGLGMTVGLGSSAGDTNVKIHLEVLEICDNEEAMDRVSIVSNISQSSAHARSPSLRYSRRENRFVSCDLAESASYSLLIPGGGNPEADSQLNISIPDTVEAHRQNSRRQTQESSGYKEEIQLLNEAYLKQEGDREE